MIYSIRKYIFGNSDKNQSAPHIFLILCVYGLIVPVYTHIFFDLEAMLVRCIMCLAIIVSYVAVERSPLSANVTAFLSPTIITAVLTYAAIYFKGDGLVFYYICGVSMI